MSRNPIECLKKKYFLKTKKLIHAPVVVCTDDRVDASYTRQPGFKSGDWKFYLTFAYYIEKRK